jgi:hypothetical protein
MEDQRTQIQLCMTLGPPKTWCLLNSSSQWMNPKPETQPLADDPDVLLS